MGFISLTASQGTTVAMMQSLNPAIGSQATSALLSAITALLSQDAQTNLAINNMAQNITYTTASGDALATKALDYNVQVSAGLPATAYVVFYTQTAPTQTITIPAGTLVSTGGDGLTTPQVQFLTQTTATISSGATDCGTPVQVIATANGSIGNVSAGSIISSALGTSAGVLVSNALSVGFAGNPTVSNPNGAGVGGVDPDTDAQVRNKIAEAATPLTGVANLQAAALAVPGVYAVYILDPQAGSGYIYYYWCAADGTNGTISGGTSTSSGAPDSTTYINGATLSGLAATVDAAIRARLPAGIVARIGTTVTATNPASVMFNVVSVTAVSVAYSAPANVQASVLDPQIKAAVIAYFNGGTVNGVTTPGLQPNQVPTIFGLSSYVTLALGQTLTNLTISSATPSGTFTDTPAANKIYRAASNITVTVTP